MKKVLGTLLCVVFAFLAACGGLEESSSVQDFSHQNADQIIDDGDDYIIEGDMRVPKDSEYGEQITAYLNGGVSLRSIRKTSTTLWPNSVLTYYFDSSVTNAERTTIRNAMKMWSDVSNVTFKESAAGKNRLEIRKTKTIPWCSATVTDKCCKPGHMCFGGSASLGYSSSPVLKYSIAGTLRAGNIAHELGHALGFNHEQQKEESRDHFDFIYTKSCKTDKDCKKSHRCDSVEKVCMNKNNDVITGSTKEFVEYDFCSIMHYDEDSEISLKDPSFDPGCKIGQRTALSYGDIRGVIDAYGEKMFQKWNHRTRDAHVLKTFNYLNADQCERVCSFMPNCRAWNWIDEPIGKPSYLRGKCELLRNSGDVGVGMVSWSKVTHITGRKEIIDYSFPWNTWDGGFELYVDGVRTVQSNDPYWTRDAAEAWCKWAYSKSKENGTYVECKYNNKFMGYELFWDGVRIGFEPSWTEAQARNNCKWNKNKYTSDDQFDYERTSDREVTCRYENSWLTI